MSAAAKVTAQDVVLSKRAQWATEQEILANPELRNCYRERFAFVGGRRFKVSAEYLDSPWWVEEVTERGWAWRDSPGRWEFNLAGARQCIADWVNGEDIATTTVNGRG